MLPLLLAPLLGTALVGTALAANPTVALCPGGMPGDYAGLEAGARFTFVSDGTAADITCRASGDGWELRGKGTDGMVHAVQVSAPQTATDREALAKAVQTLFTAMTTPPGGLRTTGTYVVQDAPASLPARPVLDLDDPVGTTPDSAKAPESSAKAPESNAKAPESNAKAPESTERTQARTEEPEDLDEDLDEDGDDDKDKVEDLDEPVAKARGSKDTSAKATTTKATKEKPAKDTSDEEDSRGTKATHTAPTLGDLDSSAPVDKGPLVGGYLSASARIFDRPDTRIDGGVSFEIGAVIVRQLWIGAEVTSIATRPVLTNPQSGKALEDGEVSFRDFDAELRLAWSPLGRPDHLLPVSPVIGVGGGLASHSWLAYGAKDHTTTALLASADLGLAILLDPKVGNVSVEPLARFTLDVGPTEVGTPSGVPVFLAPYQLDGGVSFRVRLAPPKR